MVGASVGDLAGGGVDMEVAPLGGAGFGEPVVGVLPGLVEGNVGRVSHNRGSFFSRGVWCRCGCWGSLRG